MSNSAPQKTDQIANALAGILSDSDRFAVTAKSGKILVHPLSDKDALRVGHSDLHGRLLAYEQKMIGSGNEMWFFLLGALAIDVAIFANWTRQLGIDLASLQSWWIYIASFVVAMTLNTLRLNYRAKRVFRRLEREIKEDITKSGLSVGELVSLINNDSALFNLRQRLMLE